MIILDTNVVSELLKPKPFSSVLAWFSRQPPSTVFVIAITRAELLVGLELMEEGKRRAALAVSLDQIFRMGFANRMLPFDGHAAVAYATLLVRRQRIGPAYVVMMR